MNKAESLFEKVSGANPVGMLKQLVSKGKTVEEATKIVAGAQGVKNTPAFVNKMKGLVANTERASASATEAKRVQALARGGVLDKAQYAGNVSKGNTVGANVKAKDTAVAAAKSTQGRIEATATNNLNRSPITVKTKYEKTTGGKKGETLWNKMEYKNDLSKDVKKVGLGAPVAGKKAGETSRSLIGKTKNVSTAPKNPTVVPPVTKEAPVSAPVENSTLTNLGNDVKDKATSLYNKSKTWVKANPVKSALGGVAATGLTGALVLRGNNNEQ